MGGAVPKRWRPIWCMLCALHVSTGYAPWPRIYVAFLASSSLVAITGSPGIGAQHCLAAAACLCAVPSLFRLKIFWRDYTLRAPNLSPASAQQAPFKPRGAP